MFNHDNWRDDLIQVYRAEIGLPKWLVPITAAEHKRAHREAANSGAPFSQLVFRTDGKTSRSKNQKKEDKKKAAKENDRAERRSAMEIPAHIKILSYQSSDWSDLMAQSQDVEIIPGWSLADAYKKGRGESYHLWSEGVELRQDTFHDYSPEDFIQAIVDLNSDELMEPIERKFAQKFGSYKATSFDAWHDKLWTYWDEVSFNPDSSILAQAVSETVEELKTALVQLTGSDIIEPLPVEEGIKRVTKGRNSGWPFFTSKWATDSAKLEYYIHNAKLLLSGTDTLSGTPHMLYKRVQPNGLNQPPKMRAVQCPPKHDAIAAKCLTDRFIDVFKACPPYYGFNGGENVYKVLQPYMEYDILVESDFSSFDQKVIGLMPYVFQVIRKLIPKAYWRYLQIVFDYYRHAKVLTPIGLVSSDRPNGLCSGDGWTSVIGTLANSIATKYTMRRMGVCDYMRLSFGDDIAIATDHFDVDAFERYMAELGMDCNKSKQNASTGPDAYFSFLGYYHFRSRWLNGNQGMFPMTRIATGLYYKEYFTQLESLEEAGLSDATLELLRQSPKGIELMGIAAKLNNCRNNDDFVALVDFTRQNCPNGLSTEYLMPLEELKSHIRNGRNTRSLGLADMPVIRCLYMLEELDRKIREGSVNNGKVVK